MSPDVGRLRIIERVQKLVNTFEKRNQSPQGGGMNQIVLTYLLYLAVSVTLTVWVARKLHRNGRVFLVDVFHGNESLADSVSHLLAVGFYLINLGYVSLALKLGYDVADLQGAIEALSRKVGTVLVALGGSLFTPPRASLIWDGFRISLRSTKGRGDESHNTGRLGAGRNDSRPRLSSSRA